MLTYKIHILRHGLTQANLEGRYIGRSDPPLCEQGRAQIRELVAECEYPSVQHVYTSPLLRARQTAEMIYPSQEQEAVDKLREDDAAESRGSFLNGAVMSEVLEELRDMVELDMDTIDAIAIASGPGSFTGLRIGSATAKGLGLALGKPLVEVPTLEGLAWNLWGTDRLVCPLMDARRNQVYAAACEFLPEGEGFALHTVIPQTPIDIEELLEKLTALGRPVTFLGDGVPVYREAVRAHCGVPYALAPAGSNRQRAASIAALGAVYFRQGRIVPAAAHSPVYLRKSQAEQEAGRRQQS